MNPRRPYTFIAYKSDSTDYCRGCVMARYGSDFIFESNLNSEDLVRIWAETIHKNQNLDTNEDAYEITILNQGTKVHSENEGYDGDCHYDDSEYTDELEAALDLQRRTLLAEIHTIKVAAEDKAANILNEKQRKEREAHQRQLEQEQAKQRQERLAQFEKLKQEFEPHQNP